VLFSGDGDFRYLAEKLELGGKQVISISSGGFASSELHEQVDHYFFLDRIREIWQNPKQPVKTSKIAVSTKSKANKKKSPKLPPAENQLANQPIIISDNIDNYNYLENIKIPVKICTKYL
jgi:hypothetical protein